MLRIEIGLFTAVYLLNLLDGTNSHARARILIRGVAF